MIEPAFLSIPPRRGSYGDEALDLVRMCRPPEAWPDEEQCLAVDAMLSFGPGGAWVALEEAIIEPRQLGKTTNVLLPVTLFDLFMLPPDRIVWTAHVFRTARASFFDFMACIDFSAELSRRVKRVNKSHGEESIETTKGALLEFLARERQGPRGLSGKRVVFDEALILSASAMGAALPLLSTRPNAQVMYGSSAAKQDSSQLHRLIKRGRRGGDPTLIFIEWRAEGSWAKPGCDLGIDCSHEPGVAAGCSLDDEARWQASNHAAGTRIGWDYLRAERLALPPVEFGRERLGWEEVPDELAAPIDMERWAAQGDPASSATGRVAFALDVSPDLAWSAIALAGRRADDARHWQVVEHHPGSSWLIERAAALNGAHPNFGWHVDPSSPAGSLITDMENAGLTVHQVTGRDLPQACVAMQRAAVDGSGHHLEQSVLDNAWRQARTAPSGDSERFVRRKSSGDISPLMAVTLADHGLRVNGSPVYDVTESFW